MDDDANDMVRFSLRLPKQLHEGITAFASHHGHSANSEIIRLLQQAMAAEVGDGPAKDLQSMAETLRRLHLQIGTVANTIHVARRKLEMIGFKSKRNEEQEE